MQKRVGDIEEFAFDVLTDGQQLHITLAISGWLTDEGKGKQQFLCPNFYFIIFFKTSESYLSHNNLLAIILNCRT